MKDGIVFSTIAVLLAVAASVQRGWYLFALWPFLSFAIVATGYFKFGPIVYGKSTNGKLCNCKPIFVPAVSALLNVFGILSGS